MNRPRTGSMTARLTVGITLISAAVFTAAGLLLQWTLQRELLRAEEEDLAGKMAVVRHFVDEVRDGDLEPLRHHLEDVLIGDPQMRIWILDSGGAILYGGTDVPTFEMGSVGRLHVQGADGALLVGQKERLGADTPLPGAQLVVALDTRERERLLRSYRLAISVVCGLGIIAIALLAGLLTRRSLKPVWQISRESARIAPEALGVRLSPVDTAELQELVASFTQALDRVERAYQHLEAFSADVAHELRTPLATMISGTEVALQRERSSGELRETLALNLEVLREQSKLVNDMLFLAKADRGRLADSLESTDLSVQAQKVVEYFEPVLESKRQTLEVEGTATVECNPALVRRAIVNLVGNAIRYTQDGQTITIAISHDNKQACLAVRNPGPAIALHLIPFLFERFFRADSAREPGAGHHGLGLAIVRAVALMHGGRTFALSSDGVTEIGFEFPLSAPHEVDPAQ